MPRRRADRHHAVQIYATGAQIVGLEPVLRRLKLSGACLNPASGPPAYADATAVAKSFAAAAPERMLWGSDWPRTSETHGPDDRTRAGVLVDNPAAPHGFG